MRPQLLTDNYSSVAILRVKPTSGAQSLDRLSAVHLAEIQSHVKGDGSVAI